MSHRVDQLERTGRDRGGVDDAFTPLVSIALQHEAEEVAGQAAELEPHLRLLTQAWQV